MFLLHQTHQKAYTISLSDYGSYALLKTCLGDNETLKSQKMKRTRITIDDLVAVAIFFFIAGAVIIFILTKSATTNSSPSSEASVSLWDAGFSNNSFLITEASAIPSPLISTVNPSKYGAGFFDVTAYCPCSVCCGRFADMVTASDHKIAPSDKFMAAPPETPFGTLMVVPGYAGGLPVPVLDRGSAIKGNKIDCYFDTHQEALNWGVKKLKVQILRFERFKNG